MKFETITSTFAGVRPYPNKFLLIVYFDWLEPHYVFINCY